MTTTTVVHDRMSADRAAALTVDRPTASRILPNLLGPVVTAAGVRAYGWTVTTDPTLPAGTLVIHPGLLRVTVAEAGDLDLVLAYAEQRRQAGRTLRRLVIHHAGALGLDLRPFARITLGATR